MIECAIPVIFVGRGLAPAVYFHALKGYFVKIFAFWTVEDAGPYIV